MDPCRSVKYHVPTASSKLCVREREREREQSTFEIQPLQFSTKISQYITPISEYLPSSTPRSHSLDILLPSYHNVVVVIRQYPSCPSFFHGLSRPEHPHVTTHAAYPFSILGRPSLCLATPVFPFSFSTFPQSSSFWRFSRVSASEIASGFPENWMMGIQTDRVRFNVGGKSFETTSTTLANAGRNSFFGGLFDENWDLQPNLNSSAELFVDRNPDCFAVLLDLLRTGELYVPPNVPEKLVYKEAQFYGVLDHVRAAKWGQFDGNRLWLSRSVTGRAPGDGTAIRAGPDGGCCVAHGSMVHVYDWMMEEHPPINLDYQRVNDAGWIDSENIVLSACERLGTGDGGMGLFSSSTGELRYKFQVSHENQMKSYTAGALTFSSDYKIFSSCKGRSNEYGIGVWDQITGKQIDFFYESPGWSLGDADRLQWLNGYSCLLVATLFPRKDNCYISLLDFREKKMVWSWSDVGAPMTFDEKRVRDAIAMEGSSSICVVNEYEDLGFMDLRSVAGSVRWSSRSRLRKGKMPDEPCYPKLAVHEGQLFSSMSDCISIFSGPDWVLTSRLQRSYGGSICDFSIDGDRLFALHSEENVFDIWETPPSSVL